MSRGAGARAEGSGRKSRGRHGQQGRGDREPRRPAHRRDLPRQWLVTTAYSLMHAAAEDAAAGRLDAGDAAGLITATLLAAFTPQAGQ